MCNFNYIIWSDILICPYCQTEYSFWNEAFDGEVFYPEYNCPGCEANISKKGSKTVETLYSDNLIAKEIKQKKQIPAFINYKYKGKTYFKISDQFDQNLLFEVDEYELPYKSCNSPMMFNDGKWGDMWRAGVHFGVTHTHHFYTKRNLIVLSHLFHAAFKSKYKHQMLFLITSFSVKTGSKLHNIGFKSGKINLAGAQPNSLYIPSLFAERNIFTLARGKVRDISKMFASKHNKNSSKILTQVCSATKLYLPNNSVDYVFIDPPFGDNLMYSELNFLWEDWLGVYTNNKKEAIISSFQNKNYNSYKCLMKEAFCEFYRILKPNRWITIEFHNSKSEVWNIIQDTLLKAGFIITQVAILDKKQGTKNQMTTKGAVSKDLVISAYKPKQSFEHQFLSMAGEDLEGEFIKMHLSHLKAEPTIERCEQMLYSKLLTYYVQRSYVIKYDASTFYKMLRANFVEEDGYWFNKDQLKSYREYKQKMKLERIEDLKSGQMMMFIDCEKTAIIWLNTFLVDPKTFQEVSPQYQKVSNIAGDKVPDLKELLDKNFMLENEKYRRPQTEDEKMSVTQKRERELQREFDVLLLEAKGSKKKIKECRKQSVIYGFEQCYKNNRFQDILVFGKRLDRKIIENDSEISEFIDVAELKVEGF
ncbi:DNA methylase [bacterium]|nr:DNA methylase [bacterium]